MITSVGQIALTVKDLPRAVAFYRDTLGLKFLFESNGMAFFQCDGTRLMLSASHETGSTYASIVYYKTNDIEATAATMAAKGVKFDSEPRLIAKMPDHDLWMAFFRDSEGNLLALMAEIRG